MENNNMVHNISTADLQKIYVDSPSLGDDDDDKYKYVSTNVEDFDESQLQALTMNSPLKGLVQDPVLRSPEQKSFHLSNGKQGIDGNGKGNQGNDNPRLPRTFRVPDAEQEEKELRAEQEYQAMLQHRLAKQSKEVDRLGIPRLELPVEEDSQRMSQSSTYGELHEISIRDSLDVEEFKKMKDQQHLQMSTDSLMGGNAEGVEHNNNQQNPFKLDLNDLERSPESSRGGNNAAVGNLLTAQDDDRRLKQMFHQQPLMTTPRSERVESYHQAPSYEGSLTSRQQQPLVSSEHASLPSNAVQTPSSGHYLTQSAAPLVPDNHGLQGSQHEVSNQQRDGYAQGNVIHANARAQMSPIVGPIVQRFTHPSTESMAALKHEGPGPKDQQQLRQKAPNFYAGAPSRGHQEEQGKPHQGQQEHVYPEQQMHQYRQQQAELYQEQKYHEQQYREQQYQEQQYHEQQYHEEQRHQFHEQQAQLHQEQQYIEAQHQLYLEQQGQQYLEQQGQQYLEQQGHQFHEPQDEQYLEQQGQQFHEQQYQQHQQSVHQYQQPQYPYQNKQWYQYDQQPQLSQHQFYDQHQQQPQLELSSGTIVSQRSGPIGHVLSQQKQVSAASSRALSNIPQREKPKIDFLSRNKNDYSKAAAGSKNSYSKVYTQRRQIKENLPPTPAQGKRRGGPVHPKHPAQIPKANTIGTLNASEAEEVEEVEEIEEEPQQGGAESLWSKRSQTLIETRKGAERSPGGAMKGKRKGIMHKYPSESSMDQLHKTGSAPPKLNPIKSSPRQAFTEPLRSEVDTVEPSQPYPAGKPLRHNVFTDDGQKMSVDINLKLVSPRLSMHTSLYQPALQPFHAPHQVAAPVTTRPMVSPVRVPAGYHHQVAPMLDLQDSGNWGTGHRYQPELATQPQHFYPQQTEAYAEQLAQQLAHAALERNTPLSQRSAKPASPIGSPFRILPPIGSADSSHRDTARSDGKQPDSGRKAKQYRTAPKPVKDFPPPKDTSSYMDQMRRTKERKLVEFKQYTVEDYKKLKHEVRLGGLGPDLKSNTLRERQEKRERQVEYAKNINSRNKREHLKAARTPVRRPDSEVQEQEPELLQRRRAALEYAKNVPKPKIKAPTEKVVSAGLDADPKVTTPMGNRRTAAILTPSTTTATADVVEDSSELLDLATLQRRHEEEKEKAALIRQHIHTDTL